LAFAAFTSARVGGLELARDVANAPAGWASLCRYAAQSMLAVRVSAKEQADFSTNSTNGTELAAVVRLELLYEQGCR
jgi:hypothetical protein